MIYTASYFQKERHYGKKFSISRSEPKGITIDGKMQIKAWLQQLKPEEDVTLMCWERPGQFCHRNLVIKFVERYRPDCLGGQDVVN